MREGNAFWARNALPVRKAWTAEKLMRGSTTPMDQAEADQLTDNMIAMIRRELEARAAAEESDEASDAFALSSEAEQRQEAMVKAASLLGREFTFSNAGLVRR